MTDDLILLREYARNNSEAAFATIVSRYVNLVYSVALRQVCDPHMAEEVTQAVFVILARKADSLGDKTILPGWLCRTARYASANARTTQRRRQLREQEAYMQKISNAPETEEAWTQIAPLLDDALGKLGQKDHDALVLRFFQGRNFKEVGAGLGVSEEAAKMRVTRALEKLRKFFIKRGVTSSTIIIAGVISDGSVQAAPVALAKSVTAAAIVKGAAASASTLTLIKGATKIMAWTKMKTTIVVGAVILLAATTSTILIRAVKSPKLETRTFKVDARLFMANMRNVEKSSANASAANIVAEYFAAKGLDLRPPRSIFFNEANGLLFVRATSSDLKAIEKMVLQLNYTPSQIYVKVRFIKLPEDEVESMVKAGTAVKANGMNTVEIVGADSMTSLFAQIKSRGDSETLAEPGVIIISGRQAQMRDGDSIVDLIPTLFADNHTIKMKVITSAPEALTADANVWDGQTLMLCSQKTDGKSRLIVFATTTLVGFSGNRIHSKDELPFAQNAIPPQ